MPPDAEIPTTPRRGLWRYSDGTREGKYLVQRRDGTVPDWPYFVLGAADPAASSALCHYADACNRLGFDAEYVADVLALADQFDEWRNDHTTGDPDAPKHRTDDPGVIAKMREATERGGGSA